MSDEQNQHDNQEEKGPESIPATGEGSAESAPDLDAVSKADTLILPREPEADAKPDETTPGSVLADQNPDFVPPNENPEFVARHSKRTAS